jgi:hypothetical protein
MSMSAMVSFCFVILGILLFCNALEVVWLRRDRRAVKRLTLAQLTALRGQITLAMPVQYRNQFAAHELAALVEDQTRTFMLYGKD